MKITNISAVLALSAAHAYASNCYAIAFSSGEQDSAW
jgi:hypothetical protein